MDEIPAIVKTPADAGSARVSGTLICYPESAPVRPAPLFFEDFAIGRQFRSSHDIVVTADRITSFAAEFDPQGFHLAEPCAIEEVFGSGG